MLQARHLDATTRAAADLRRYFPGYLYGAWPSDLRSATTTGRARIGSGLGVGLMTAEENACMVLPDLQILEHIDVGRSFGRLSWVHALRRFHHCSFTRGSSWAGSGLAVPTTKAHPSRAVN